MAPRALSSLVVLAAAATLAVAQDASVTGLKWAPTPLVSLSFPKPSDAPEKVWPDEPAYVRGIQTGYNRCNSTTEVRRLVRSAHRDVVPILYAGSEQHVPDDVPERHLRLLPLGAGDGQLDHRRH
jgi:hypothetical protein